jgi:hypothetical protein
MSAGPGASQSSGFAPADLLTSSRLRTWRACPRQHFYRYELARASHGPESAASALGTAVHAALEAWWCTWRDLGGYGALDAALYAARGDEDAEADRERDPYTVALTQALVIAYDARWSRWAAGVEVLGVEAPFVAALWEPATGRKARRWAVAGKMDVLLRLSDGRVAIVDHKVTASDARVGSDWRRKLTLDPQVSTYFGGAEALGHPADLALWDVLQRPSIKPLMATPVEDRQYTQPKSRACKACKKSPETAPHAEGDLWCVEGRIVTDSGGRLYAAQRDTDETPDEYQERLIARLADEGPEAALAHVEVVRTDAEREAHTWALWHTVREIEESRAAVRACDGDARAVTQNAGACMAYGSPCPYLPVCEGTASIDDPTRYRRLPVAHAELPAEMQVQTHNAQHP